ncbi:MAG: TetR/AcrR family transcriptional regulator [Negativicutes bacterium]
MLSEEKDTSKIILAAAFKRISSCGYANVSMRDIAEEAGVVLSQLNYYYKNKEGLFIAVIRAVKQEYLKKIESNIQQMPTSQEKISFLLNYCQEVIRNDTYLYRLLLDFFSMSMWSKSCQQEFAQFFVEIDDVISKYIINDYSINPQMQDFSPKQITRLVIASTFGIAMQHISDPENEEAMNGLAVIQSLIK